MPTRLWVLALTITSLARAAQAAEAPGISGRSDGRWQMNCHVVADGSPTTVLLGSDRPAYSNAKLSRAECKYRVSSENDLAITVAGPEACPFAAASADACTLTAAKGKAGSFNFRVKR